MNPVTPWPGPVPDITSSVLALICGGAGGLWVKTAPAGATCTRSAPNTSPRRTGTRPPATKHRNERLHEVHLLRAPRKNSFARDRNIDDLASRKGPEALQPERAAHRQCTSRPGSGRRSREPRNTRARSASDLASAPKPCNSRGPCHLFLAQTQGLPPLTPPLSRPCLCRRTRGAAAGWAKAACRCWRVATACVALGHVTSSYPLAAQRWAVRARGLAVAVKPRRGLVSVLPCWKTCCTWLVRALSDNVGLRSARARGHAGCPAFAAAAKGSRANGSSGYVCRANVPLRTLLRAGGGGFCRVAWIVARRTSLRRRHSCSLVGPPCRRARLPTCPRTARDRDRKPGVLRRGASRSTRRSGSRVRVVPADGDREAADQACSPSRSGGRRHALGGHADAYPESYAPPGRRATVGDHTAALPLCAGAECRIRA